MNRSSSYTGLFGYAKTSCTLKNITIASGSISGSSYVGAIIGDSYATTTITNCVNNAEIKGTDGYVGGIVGRVYTSKILYAFLHLCVYALA